MEKNGGRRILRVNSRWNMAASKAAKDRIEVGLTQKGNSQTIRRHQLKKVVIMEKKQ